ncbi:MAG TPA: hypothetical protein VJ063_01860 [Verrucomicrobiae bacterium]|nr:hypothetical protein [Verrucomicrobiae bacterium]
MKTVSRPLFATVVFALANLVFAGQNMHAEDIFISQFNDANSLNGWRFDFGGVTRTLEFDGTQDANNNAASGALKVTFGFDAATLNPSGNNKGAITIDLPSGLDGLSYVTMEMDLRIEPGSATDGGGNSGYFQMVIRNGNGYAYNSQFGDNVRTNVTWRHITANVTGGRDNIRAVTLELYGGAGLTGPVVFYVDNIKFTKPSPARDVVVSRFDDASALANWRFDYGGVTNLIQFDPSQDASNNAASGSMKVTFGFDPVLDISGNNKGALTLDLPTPIDASSYQTLEMDVKIDPASATDASGNSGYFQLVIRYSGFYDWNPQFGGNLRISDGWRRIRVAPPVPPVNEVYAFTMELYGGAGLSGPVTFYVDNLKFTTTNVAPPQPMLSIEQPRRGLNLIPTSGQYQRQNIVAAGSPGYSWIGSTEPVTYSLTIHKHPDASHTGFQTHMFLVPAAPTDSAPDYSQANVIFLDIQSQSGGAAYASFRYKVNEPGGNSFLYGAGTLGGVSSPSPIGTWSLTFSNDTDLMVTAPGGASANFSLPPAAAALFANPLAVWVGAQPNAGGNIGQTVVLSNVRVTRAEVVLLEDNFLTDETLDTQKWQVFAGDPVGVRLVGSDAAFWLSWTIPDSGFVLQRTSNLEDPNSWIATGGTAPLIGNNKKIFVHKYNDDQQVGEFYAPPNPQAFYRLIHP